MFESTHLFVRAIDKLTAIAVQPTPDALFDSLVLIRQLLMDQHPLIHQANQKFRFKIRFNVVPMDIEGMPDFLRKEGIILHIDAFAPWAVPHRKSITVSIDGFLAQPIIMIDGQEITVRETIDYLGHYSGAIHKRNPDTAHTKALETFSTEFNPRLGSPFVLRVLRPIIQIVVSDTYPLYQAITDTLAAI